MSYFFGFSVNDFYYDLFQIAICKKRGLDDLLQCSTCPSECLIEGFLFSFMFNHHVTERKNDRQAPKVIVRSILLLGSIDSTMLSFKDYAPPLCLMQNVIISHDLQVWNMGIEPLSLEA